MILPSFIGITNKPADAGGTVGLTGNTPQGVLGRFTSALVTTVDTTSNNTQGILGEFTYVIDNSNAGT